MKPTELPAFSDSFVRATALASLAVNLTTPALQNFKDKLEKLCTVHQVENFPKAALLCDIKMEFECGPKFIRVIRTEYGVVDGVMNPAMRQSRSAHCFIDRTNGDILKAAGWKAPEKKNPRGNIFGADPLRGVTAYGTVYLR